MFPHNEPIPNRMGRIVFILDEAQPNPVRSRRPAVKCGETGKMAIVGESPWPGALAPGGHRRQLHLALLFQPAQGDAG